jgi:hypothetical protein
MSWDDFTACAGNDGQILLELGEDTVRQLEEFWEARSPMVKAILIAAGRYGGEYLAKALTAAGIAAADAVAVVAGGVGLGVMMAVIYDCYDRLQPSWWAGRRPDRRWHWRCSWAPPACRSWSGPATWRRPCAGCSARAGPAATSPRS